MKKCSRCGVEKENAEFDKNNKNGLDSRCKSCKKEINSKRLFAVSIDHKVCNKCGNDKPWVEFSIKRSNTDGLMGTCKKCCGEHGKTKRARNTSLGIKNYSPNRKRPGSDYYKNYYLKNREVMKEKIKLNYIKNKDTTIKKVQKYKVKRKNSDPVFKLRVNLRSVIKSALKRKGFVKALHTHEILGLPVDECLDHLFVEAKNRYCDFKPENFLNNNLYHIHHKIPIEFAKTEQEVIWLNHYSNLELLTVEDHKKIHS